MADADTETGTFAQAAEAAEALLDQIQSYQSALDEIAGLRADARDLRDELAAAVEPTRELARAAQAAAQTYGAVEAARPHVEQSLSAFQASATQTADVLAQATEAAALKASERIEASAQSAADRVDGSAQTLDATLARTRETADALDAKVSTDGAAAADALVDALRAATAQVREDAEATLTSLALPARQTGAAVVRVQETVDAAGVSLSREVAGATVALRQGVSEALDDMSRARSADLRRLVQLAWATLAVVTLFGLLSVARGCGAPADPGLDLRESTVQVLNGVDPASEYAAEVGSLLTSGPGGDVKAVIRADAPTSRQQRTMILVHGATMEAGRQLASQLGMNEERVVQATPLPLAGQLSLLLGADFRDAIPAAR